MSLRKVFCGVRIVYVHFGKRIVSCTLSRTLCGLCQSPYTYAYTCTHIYIHIHAEGMQKYTHLYVRVYLSLYTDKYVHNIYIYIYIRLWWSSSWFLLIYRLMSVPPIPMPMGQDFSSQGARTIQVYLYKYTSIRRSSPGKLCVGSALGMCVLDLPWETMSWITPGKLCVVSFGPQLLGPEPWFPVLGRQGPWPMAHWASMCYITFGRLCVASVLGNYVLHRP